MSSEQETAMSQEIEADQAPQSTTEKDVQKEEKAEETSKEPDFCLESILLVTTFKSVCFVILG